MPTYVVTAPEGRLSPEQKRALAARITAIHCAATGAPAYFAQVLFSDVKPGNYFIAGRPLEDDNIFVHGQIRAGRSAEVKERLLLDLMNGTAEAAGAHPSHVQVYLVDVPARQIAEFGQILPLPGEEAAWDAAVPEAVKKRMAALVA